MTDVVEGLFLKQEEKPLFLIILLLNVDWLMSELNTTFSGSDSPRSSRSSVCPAVLLRVLVLSLAPEPCPEEGEAAPLCSRLFPRICVSESSGAPVFQPPGSSCR